MNPTPRIFTRERPCNKVDMLNCFWTGKTYRARPVVEAHAVIGVNAPKYLLAKGLATHTAKGDVEVYTLTAEGERWLTQGVREHLKRHPADLAACDHAPPAAAATRAPKATRATRPAPAGTPPATPRTRRSAPPRAPEAARKPATARRIRTINPGK